MTQSSWEQLKLRSNYHFDPKMMHPLYDTVDRVGRDPIRKLSSQERLIGAAKFAEKYEVKPINLCIGIASAIKFQVKEDKESEKLAKYLEEKGINWILKEICHINPDGDLAKLIKQNL